MTSAKKRMESNLFLGIDTSCYTSSIACVKQHDIICDKRILLSVGDGERGLRQSDAVFQQTRNLSDIVRSALDEIDPGMIKAVGVSSCPSGRPNSYMPVFLSGKTVAEAIAASLRVPIRYWTHQQGHIRAALHGNEQLIGNEFIAFHLSGGTSDLLRVGSDFSIEKVGGSSDINAGQLVDRIGVRLGLRFPAGRQLEQLASGVVQDNKYKLPSSVKGLSCSFSGIETKAAAMIDAGAPCEQVAASVYDCLARTLAKLIINSLECFQISSFLLAGGVASSLILNRMLRERLRNSGVRLFFAEPKLASDNAVGIALLTGDLFEN